MRVHVVSDVHGNADALARAGDGADALVVLGDLIDFVDYHQHEKGILGRLFGAEKVKVFADLRRSGDREATIAYSRELWGSLDEAAARVEEAIREQYAELFGAMTAPTYATPGNVDAPWLWPEFAGGEIHVLDGDVAKIGGLRFGFVGGSLRPDNAPLRTSSAWTPYLRSHDEFAEAVAGLGQIDVLCSHIPPDIPELTYDVVTKRSEAGAPSLRDAIERERPRWSLFGHVHQPLAERLRIGGTECCNAGHFKLRERPLVLRW
ncbi:metallophosphoesterase family protein [Haloechinothrix salitolerans]|uniref:Metallophosphoesterase n=1 Tax=Haloechinothrix salitolerans TaxID=926830 RepID=A0ABW2C344_9PSEU